MNDHSALLQSEGGRRAQKILADLLRVEATL